MPAFDSSLPFPTGGTGSISRNTFGFSKEPRALGVLGNEPHQIRSLNIQAAINYIKRDESHKKPEQKANMLSLLLFKIAVLGLTPGQDAKSIIRNLVENGADVRIKNRSGATPLMMACLFGNFDLVPALLQYPGVASDMDRATINASGYAIESSKRHTERLRKIAKSIPRTTTSNLLKIKELTDSIIDYSAESIRISESIGDARSRNDYAEFARIDAGVGAMLGRGPNKGSVDAKFAQYKALVDSLESNSSTKPKLTTSEKLAEGRAMFSSEDDTKRKRKEKLEKDKQTEQLHYTKTKLMQTNLPAYNEIYGPSAVAHPSAEAEAALAKAWRDMYSSDPPEWLNTLGRPIVANAVSTAADSAGAGVGLVPAASTPAADAASNAATSAADSAGAGVGLVPAASTHAASAAGGASNDSEYYINDTRKKWSKRPGSSEYMNMSTGMIGTPVNPRRLTDAMMETVDDSEYYLNAAGKHWSKEPGSNTYMNLSNSMKPGTPTLPLKRLTEADMDAAKRRAEAYAERLYLYETILLAGRAEGHSAPPPLDATAQIYFAEANKPYDARRESDAKTRAELYANDLYNYENYVIAGRAEGHSAPPPLDERAQKYFAAANKPYDVRRESDAKARAEHYANRLYNYDNYVIAGRAEGHSAPPPLDERAQKYFAAANKPYDVRRESDAKVRAEEYERRLDTHENYVKAGRKHTPPSPLDERAQKYLKPETRAKLGLPPLAASPNARSARRATRSRKSRRNRSRKVRK